MSHAQLYIADSLESSGVAPELRQKGADVEHFFCDGFGIGEARELQKRAYLKPVVRDTRDFVVSFSSITVEAQNALLKLFEDPPEGAVFHLVVAREDILLSTLRSRLLLVSTQSSQTETDTVKMFLKMLPGERMEEIAKRTKAKDIEWIEALATGAEKFAASRPVAEKETLLRSVVYIRGYLGARGASSKMLLEALALSLPKLR